MRRISVSTFLFWVSFIGISSAQQTNRSIAPDAMFAYAVNARQLVTIGTMPDESHARSFTKAICPGNMVTAAVSLATGKQSGLNGGPGFQFEAADNLSAGNYCLLVDSKTQEKLFVWGETSSSPVKVPCAAGDLAKAGEELTGHKVSSCERIGGYGTGALELLEFAHESATDRLAALMVVEYALDGGQTFSITRFASDNEIWAADKDGEFHAQRFRHLFTISENPETSPWLSAVEWDGPTGADLTLYQPMGTELRPVLVSHDSVHRKARPSEIASK